jgi:hypothetical protein
MDHPLGHRVPVPPSGERAMIEVAGQKAAVVALHGPDPAPVVAAVLAFPQAYAPPVLGALAAVLFARGERDEAAFWFYAAQLRARFDANRCADPTAAGAVGVLTRRYGPEINRHAFADPAGLRSTVERVVRWDRATPHDYDHRWINLHGMGVFTGAAPLSRPKAEWAAIAERTRQEYLRGLDEVLDGGRR